MSTQRALTLFDELVDLPPQQQSARLACLARDEPEVAASLERLLEADRLDRGLTAPAARYAQLLDGADDDAARDAGATIGPWRLEREIGRGGMGTVWLASRADGGFEQQAALKLIKRGMDSDAVVARFLAERQILARLEHPNIARLLDGGVAADGRPYFAMELVEGVPMLEFARAQELDLRARLALFGKVCDAVAYAHSRLVVHRDLKPSNILVQQTGEPKLLDFGIAKVLTAETEDATATAQGPRFLTPAYAAPEQLAGEPVGTATDVYALGLVLHELLTGARAPGDARATGRPSAARARAGADGPAAIRPRQLAGDIDTIVLRALAPEPARRYAGAQALGDDLERFLDGRPVRARPDSAAYRTGKFVARHRAALAFGALAVAALLASTAVSLAQARIARAEAARATRESAAAQAVKDFLLDAFTSADPYRTDGRQVSARELLETGAARIEGPALAEQPRVRAELHEAFGDTFAKLDRTTLAAAQYDRALALYAALGEADSPRAISIEVGRLNGDFQDGRLDGLEERLRGVLARIGDGDGELVAPKRDALNVLAFTLWKRGRYDDAARAAEDLMAVSDRERGDDSTAAAFAIYTLALIRLDAGRLAEAAALIERFVALDVKNTGADSPGLVTDVQLIGRMLLELDRVEPARELFEAAVAARTRHFGPAHRLTASAIAGLARVQARLGADAAARAGFAQALATYESEGRRPNAESAALRIHFARFELEHGDADAARALLGPAREDFLALGGAAHPRVAVIDALLAGIDGRRPDAAAEAPHDPALDAAADRLLAAARGILARAAAARAAEQKSG